MGTRRPKRRSGSRTCKLSGSVMWLKRLGKFGSLSGKMLRTLNRWMSPGPILPYGPWPLSGSFHCQTSASKRPTPNCRKDSHLSALARSRSHRRAMPTSTARYASKKVEDNIEPLPKNRKSLVRRGRKYPNQRSQAPRLCSSPTVRSHMRGCMQRYNGRVALQEYRFPNCAGGIQIRTNSAPDPTRGPVGRDVLHIESSAQGLKNVADESRSHQRCKGCELAVGPWVDYCTCEDEGDCW